ncbi:protein FAM149B1 isoform X2 [Heptranchias perlo]|uniref:protein FAM149B1 isoform X2 n=1 Tax=Heptranchias perlo TaxID=212740 RepID=UPI00355A7115
MIHRYNRRPVRNAPEIHGLSRCSLENHPLPEKLEEHSTPSPVTSVEDADFTCSGESETSEDTSSQPLLADFGHHGSAINSYTGTRLSTACSSTFSWGDNEFEKATSQQVQQMFCEVDELLFEEKTCSRVQGLEKECQEWKCSFPHFRILGRQIVVPVDEAYCWYPGPQRVTTPLSTSSPGPGTDVNEEDDSCEKKLGLALQYENRLGLPPISPSHCRRNTIVSELFDEVWLEVLGCMEELIRKHWEGHVSDEERSTASVDDAGTDPMNLFLPPEPVPQISQVRVPAFSSYLTKSQRFGTTDWLAGQLQKAVRSQPRWCATGITFGPDEVQRAHIGAVQRSPNSLQIQGIPFYQRNPPLPGKIQDSDERPVLRPFSSTLSSNRFRSNHLLEHSVSSLSRPVHSARRRNPPRTLHPIHSSLSHSGTPVDEVVRGIRLQTASDRLSAPTPPVRHNALLPPISSADINHSAEKLTARPQKMRMRSNRAHSAVIDETSHLPPRDRFLGHEYFTRPKTTHTFRSDISCHRSFTALDYAHQSPAGRRSEGPGYASIGVTGISLSISSSSHLDMLQDHCHGGSLVEAEEKMEDQPSLGHRLPLPIRPHIRGGIASRSRTAL